MVYGEAQLEDAVRTRISGSPVLAERVTMVGAVTHDRIGEYFSAADIFISGSHHEGSGYSLIEAMACGVMPCVTNIPAFRALVGDCGVLWKVGDAPACAAGLLALARRDRESERGLVQARYESALSWKVIGERTVREYGALVQQRLHGCSRQ
jgi:glycosyltransferase involved in cell wall biosynthesis